ncbi:hypothetical protein KIPB_006246 [Kipferlia bialata]|uniref:Uncharacterized protein n=1 Tax=Kipferlia bialata TaxID=797122 RepID=A0A9K3CYK2_9EUKA|nr:hypothetical protein KIPB_006246 [Kipferlia bialata]|eukprot:g6246.t1
MSDKSADSGQHALRERLKTLVEGISKTLEAGEYVDSAVTDTLVSTLQQYKERTGGNDMLHALLNPDADSAQASMLPRKDGLLDHVTFPPFRDLSDHYDPSLLYHKWSGRDTLTHARHWCFLATITSVITFPRTIAFCTTMYGEKTQVPFYPEDKQDERDLHNLTPRMRPGTTLAILYAERKQFFDGSAGIRVETPRVCMVFDQPLNELVATASTLMARADGTETPAQKERHIPLGNGERDLLLSLAGLSRRTAKEFRKCVGWTNLPPFRLRK